MSNFELIKELNMLEYYILDNAYIEDWDGDDEHGRPIKLQYYRGLKEEEIKSLLEKIGNIINLVKEGVYYE